MPEPFKVIMSRSAAELVKDEQQKPESTLKSSTLEAWENFLKTPFLQIENYHRYITGHASFDTHQGVKGLQFDRVMVVIDDSETRGFNFSYDKLFGVKDKTRADLENERAGKETGIDRTLRLFYVTCSRAKHSLAIVAYSESGEVLKKNIIAREWFRPAEIEVIQ
jgi:DNA helicase-2/ATP-dependent DNA helicase PcrA